MKMILRTCLFLVLLLGLSQAEKKERRFRKRGPKGDGAEKELKGATGEEREPKTAAKERELKGGNKGGSHDYDDDRS